MFPAFSILSCLYNGEFPISMHLAIRRDRDRERPKEILIMYK